MKTFNFILTVLLTSTTLIACSPPEPSSETFLDGQRKALNKAKTIEQIGFEHKADIDRTVDQAK